MLCEAYGAGGWDSSPFDDYKRIGDWLMVHGINFINQHLTFSTIVGARKQDHPQSLDWRQPWWSEYKALNDYHSRLYYALSQGETHNRILLLNPTTSAYFTLPGSVVQGLNFGGDGIYNEFLELSQHLCDKQWDYDYGDEYIIVRHGQVEDGKFLDFYNDDRCGIVFESQVKLLHLLLKMHAVFLHFFEL